MKKISRKVSMILAVMIVSFCFLFVTKTEAASTMKLSVYVGDQYTLEIPNATKVTWTTSNKKVVTVTKSGKITAKSVGKANITGKSGGKAYKCSVTVKKLDFTGKHKECGDGTMVINTAISSSKNGKIPIMYVDKDTLFDEIGISVRDFDGEKITYMYVDGRLCDKQNIADYDGSIGLTGATLNPGIHKVEIVQYSNNKPTGKIVTYKTAQYRIK